MNEEWLKMNEEWWRMKAEWWRMMISSCCGVLLTDRWTDICECWVAFATEKMKDGDEYDEEGSEEGGGKGDDECGNA